MATELINIAELKAHISGLLEKVSSTGKSVIIGKYGKPVAKLVPYQPETDNQPRKAGFGKHLALASITTIQEQVDAPHDDETLQGFYQ
ncbi:type II toxin-antitoxin system Phd/YefM family antitoxin [Porticoccus sp. GXU_MW_L64]